MPYCPKQSPLSPASPSNQATPRPDTLGWQDTSAAFASLAADCDVTLSHGRTGQCWDNALSESFFAALKGELIDLQPWP